MRRTSTAVASKSLCRAGDRTLGPLRSPYRRAPRAPKPATAATVGFPSSYCWHSCSWRPLLFRAARSSNIASTASSEGTQNCPQGYLMARGVIQPVMALAREPPLTGWPPVWPSCDDAYDGASDVVDGGASAWARASRPVVWWQGLGSSQPGRAQLQGLPPRARGLAPLRAAPGRLRFAATRLPPAESVTAR